MARRGPQEGLIDAIRERDLAAARNAIKAGANVNFRNESGQPLLHMAVSDSSEEIVLALLRAGAEIGATDAHGMTPLHYAVRHRSLHLFWQMVRRGADVNAVATDGTTVLHMAAAEAYPEVLEELLRHHDIAQHTKDGEGRSALHRAAESHSPEKLAMLIDAGADLAARDNHGATPLHLAVFGNHLENARLLLDRGADPRAVLNDGSTLLHLSVHNVTEPAPGGMIDLLLDRNVPIDAVDAGGGTALHAAAGYFPTAVARLAARGAALSMVNLEGHTPLHLAAINGNADAARILVDAGAAIDVQDREGRTPLELAAERALSLDPVASLLRSLSDTPSKSWANRTVKRDLPPQK